MRFALVFYGLLCTSAFAQQAGDLHQLLDEYVEYRVRESVPLAFHLGRTVSGRDWPDRSSAGIESRRQTNLLYRKRLEPFLTASLSPQAALNARLLRYVLEQEIAAEPVSTYLQPSQPLQRALEWCVLRYAMLSGPSELRLALFHTSSVIPMELRCCVPASASLPS